MARQNHTVQTMPVWKDGTLASNGDETVMTFTACDASNYEMCDFTGQEVLLFTNTGSTQRTFTIEGVLDSLGRTADLGPVQVEAGEMHRIQIDSYEGFRQTTGKLHFRGSHAELEVAVIRPRRY